MKTNCCKSGLILCLCLAIRVCIANSSQQPIDSKVCDTLYLLNVVPYPDNRTFTGWDRGFELIPAGHLATKHINNNSNILPGYKLEVIDVDSEACGINIIAKGVAEYHKQVYYSQPTCIVGIIGLFCSTVTNVIAPIANHPMIGHVQLAASTSPLHRNITYLPYTFHTIASSSLFNEAMLALMLEFKWKKLSVVYGSGLFFRTTAVDFVQLLHTHFSMGNVSVIQIAQGRSVSQLFDIFSTKEERIGYFTVTNSETAKILCEAYKRNFLSRYTFILHERTLSEVYATPVNCTRAEIDHSLESMFMLRYRLVPPEQTENVTFSGMTYKQYRRKYIQELRKFKKETGMKQLDENNLYANVLYDQVWAFALAANKSLDIVNFFNSSITPDKSIKIRDILTRELIDIEFDGVSGFIKLGQKREVQTFVDIYRVRNGTEVLIGMYDAYNRSIYFEESFDRSTVPRDQFNTRYLLIPLWLGSSVILCNSILIILTLFNTISIIWLRNLPEIKSTGFYLNLFIFFGCYLILFSTVLLTAQETFIIANDASFAALCSMEFWLFIDGTNIILVTLLVRLFRIFHVFGAYHSTGRFWSDKFLIFYITIICSPMIIVLIVQSVVDPFRVETRSTFVASTQLPYKLVHKTCYYFLNIWLTLPFTLIGLVMISVVFLAIQTRHIKRKHFKDTKKVNMFIFSVCIVYAVFIPLWLILSAVHIDTWAYVCECIAKLGGAALCQIFLFLPKTLPAIFKTLKT